MPFLVVKVSGGMMWGPLDLCSFDLLKCPQLNLLLLLLLGSACGRVEGKWTALMLHRGAQQA